MEEKNQSQKIKAIFFDLDGVLSDSSIHYHSLNRSLADIDKRYVINETDHFAKYNALPTRKKLDMLTVERGLPPNLHEQVR